MKKLNVHLLHNKEQCIYSFFSEGHIIKEYKEKDIKNNKEISKQFKNDITYYTNNAILIIDSVV